jgi:uncharacterized protein YndB with AHSA1/START domain
MTPTGHGSTLVELPNDRVVVLTRTFDAPIGLVFVTLDGVEMSFRGTYLEVDPPTRTVETWLFDGRPDGDAIESQDLHEDAGVTTLTVKLEFNDPAGRPTRFEGMAESFDRIHDCVERLQREEETG